MEITFFKKMTIKEIIQENLNTRIPGSIFVSSKQILNSLDNYYIVNYILDNNELITNIPGYIIDNIKKVEDEKTILTLNSILTKLQPNGKYLGYGYSSALKKYNIYYSLKNREFTINVSVDEYNVESENISVEKQHIDEIVFVIKALLSDEIKGQPIYVSHELIEGNTPDENFYCVSYKHNMVPFDEPDRFDEILIVNFDEKTVSDLLTVVEQPEIEEDIESEIDEIEPEPETDNLPPRALPLKGRPGIRPKNDKIFNNDWNNVEMDYDNAVTIDEEFSFKYFSTDIDHQEFLRLNEEIYAILKTQPNLQHIVPIMSEKIKVSKREADKIYLEIRKHLGGKYPEAFIFMNVCEILETNYNSLYEKLPSKIKEILIKEMDQKYDLLKKRGLKKLF